MKLRDVAEINDDDQTSSIYPPLLYFSSTVVSEWDHAPCTKLGKQAGPKETFRCLQGRVGVHRFLPIRS